MRHTNAELMLEHSRGGRGPVMYLLVSRRATCHQRTARPSRCGLGTRNTRRRHPTRPGTRHHQNLAVRKSISESSAPSSRRRVDGVETRRDNLIYALVRTFQILQVQSLDAEASNSQCVCDASARWQGSHASAVIHFACLFRTRHSPSERHTLTSPSSISGRDHPCIGRPAQTQDVVLVSTVGLLGYIR